MPDAEKVRAVREALPAAGAGIYLNAPVAGPLPAESAAAMAEVAEWELRTGRAHRDRDDDVIARIEEARGAVAAILTADLEEVGIAHGIGDAFRRALGSIPWRDDDQVAVLRDPATSPVLDHLAARRTLVFDELSALPEDARVVVLPLVRSTTGERLPVESVASEIRARGGVLLVEASLGLGAAPLSLPALGADLLVARSEAWLLGPEGLAVVAGRGTRGAAGGFHLPSVVGFARGCGWLSMYVGLPWIHDRGALLTSRAVDRLGAVEGLELLTPPSRATTLAFRMRGWTAPAALEELGSRIFLLASAVADVDAIRIGIGCWNTEEEIDRLADVLALLAQHTPETLPRRPRLAILGEG